MGNGECKMCPTPSLKNRRGMGNREWGMRMEYYRAVPWIYVKILSRYLIHHCIKREMMSGEWGMVGGEW